MSSTHQKLRQAADALAYLPNACAAWATSVMCFPGWNWSSQTSQSPFIFTNTPIDRGIVIGGSLVLLLLFGMSLHKRRR